MDNTDFVPGPVPGFLDAVGQTVREGDWVVTGVGGRYNYGIRLARVLAIEPRERTRVARYEPKPKEEWTDWERRYYTDKKPATRAIEEAYVEAKVTVTQYPDMDPKTKPIRRELSTRGSLKYTGPIPFDLS